MSDSSLPSWTVIAFTGHRSLAHPEVVTKALGHAVNLVTLKHPRVAGISSAANGGDTLFAEEMLRRECPLSIILPFPCERFHEDFRDNEAAWTRVQKVLENAHVEVLLTTAGDFSCPDSASSRPPGERTPEQKAADNAAYMDAGYLTVDRADMVIAVWDQLPAKGFGGTEYVVNYARALNMPILIIDPETGRLIKERFDSDPEEDAASSAGTNVIPPAIIDPIDDPRKVVNDYFHQVNVDAKRHGPKARFLVRICLQLYMAASALGLANLVFHPDPPGNWILTATSFATLVTASVMMFFFARNHGRWLQCRVDAEVCRSFLATWDIRRHATLGHQPRPAIPGLKRLFSDLRLLRQMDTAPKIGLDEARSKYNIDRVEGQLAYFKGELAKAKRSLFGRKRAMKICTIAAVIFEGVVFWFVAVKKQQNEFTEWLEFFAYTLPLLATALGLTLITQEAARRAARYQEMVEALEQLHCRLRASNTWDSLARVATEVEEELLQELVEWRSFIRFTRDVAHPG